MGSCLHLKYDIETIPNFPKRMYTSYFPLFISFDFFKLSFPKKKMIIIIVSMEEKNY